MHPFWFVNYFYLQIKYIALIGINQLKSNDHAKVLQILDLLKNLDRYLDCSYDEARKIIKKYSLANHITRESIDKYIRNFPDSTFRFYYEMKLSEL